MLVSLLPTFVLAFVLPRVAPPSPAARAVVLALDNLGDGDESEEVELYDGDESEEVELYDGDSQSSLPCFLAGTISVGGATYGALHPVNLPVSIATYEDDELMPVDEERERAVLAKAIEECEKVDVTLYDTPVVLTAEGLFDVYEGPPEDEDEAGEGGAAGDDDEEDEEDVQVVTSFEDGGEEVYVLRLLEPVYAVGKQDGDRFVVPTESEIDAATPLVENLLNEQLFTAGEDEGDFSP